MLGNKIQSVLRWSCVYTISKGFFSSGAVAHVIECELYLWKGNISLIWLVPVDHIAQCTVYNFCLAIRLRMTGGTIYLSEVSNIFHRSPKNGLGTYISIIYNWLWNIIETDYFEEKVGNVWCVIFFCHGRKFAILVNRLTMTKIESIAPFWVRGRPSTKSILKSSHMFARIDKGVYNLVFWVCPFPTWHKGHVWTNLLT